MKAKRFATATVVVTLAWMTSPSITWTEEMKKEVIGLTPEQVPWFTPSYYKDGRQRAQMFGNSGQGGAWIDRVKIPSGMRVLAHTHPDTELVTVIEGTWYLGAGERFDPTKLKGYPAGSFIAIPAGVPHFVATKEGTVIVQTSGNGIFRTDFLEK
jgi:quercetin dioxygenase-like cupin family protein